MWYVIVVFRFQCKVGSSTDTLIFIYTAEQPVISANRYCGIITFDPTLIGSHPWSVSDLRSFENQLPHWNCDLHEDFTIRCSQLYYHFNTMFDSLLTSAHVSRPICYLLNVTVFYWKYSKSNADVEVSRRHFFER